MPKTSFKELLDAGVHFGHLKRKWNPAMSPYIFMEKNGIHIIDLSKTEIKLNDAANAMKQIAKSGRKILFVATKKQAKDIVAEKVKAINMPYVTERWPGGMLTNFPTIRKAVKKMSAIDKMAADGTFETLSKRERLQIERQRAKLEKNLGSIADLTRLPAAMFVVDVHKEYIAVREANRLNIPVFAMVDTNSDPRDIDFPIPANDDASKSISLIVGFVTEAIAEGLNERKMEKEKEASEIKAKAEKKADKSDKKAEKVEVKAEKKDEKKQGKKVEKVDVDAELDDEDEPVAEIEEEEEADIAEDLDAETDEEMEDEMDEATEEEIDEEIEDEEDERPSRIKAKASKTES